MTATPTLTPPPLPHSLYVYIHIETLLKATSNTMLQHLETLLKATPNTLLEHFHPKPPNILSYAPILKEVSVVMDLGD